MGLAARIIVATPPLPSRNDDGNLIHFQPAPRRQQRKRADRLRFDFNNLTRSQLASQAAICIVNQIQRVVYRRPRVWSARARASLVPSFRRCRLESRFHFLFMARRRNEMDRNGSHRIGTEPNETNRCDFLVGVGGARRAPSAAQSNAIRQQQQVAALVDFSWKTTELISHTSASLRAARWRELGKQCAQRRPLVCVSRQPTIGRLCPSVWPLSRFCRPIFGLFVGEPLGGGSKN